MVGKKIAGVLDKGTSIVNKTGTWKDKAPVWDEKKCIHCMICYVNCPENCILLVKDKQGNAKRDKTNLDYCKGCGICANVCPVKCIKME
jgi:pyruvate ferredoxin oxidoreductase delta subunit